jgi:hypothetical protein
VSAVDSVSRAWTWIIVAGLVLVGTLLRLRDLAEGAMFIDEAESSLNALSIREHGYPADTYLGLPMFENTLTEPWPDLLRSGESGTDELVTTDPLSPKR